MSKRVMYQTETKAVVKVWGTDSSDTITLATDLLSSTMTVTGTPTANITNVTWFVSNLTGADAVTVTRNSVPVFNLYQNGKLDFAGEGGFSDDTENTSNIVVSIVGTGGCYLTFRKAAGYSSKIEPWQFGSYDNTAAVGS